ncbi:MAG: hypothetical protein AAFU41_08375 [Pseudomonadota bacterium]
MDLVVPATERRGMGGFGGFVDGGWLTSQTTAVRGVMAILIDFPRSTAEALLDAFTRLPDLGDKIARMQLGVIGYGQLMLLAAGGDLSERVDSAEWISPHLDQNCAVDNVGRLVFYGRDDLIPVDGPSIYNVTTTERQTAAGTFARTRVDPCNPIEWITDGPLNAPRDAGPLLNVADVQTIIDRAHGYLEAEGWQSLRGSRKAYTLAGEPDGERGDVLDDGRIVIEVTERGKRWRAAYDPQTDFTHLPRQAGVIPSAAELRADMLARHWRPRRQTKLRQPVTPKTKKEQQQ